MRFEATRGLSRVAGALNKACHDRREETRPSQITKPCANADTASHTCVVRDGNIGLEISA